MFSTLIARAAAIQRSTRAPSNWSFNTRFPKPSKGKPIKGKRYNSNANSNHKLSGLALPPTKRLARLGSGVSAKSSLSSSRSLNQRSNSSASSAASSSQSSTTPARTVVKTAALTAAAALVARNEAQRRYDEKFAMVALDSKPATVAQLTKTIQSATFKNMGLMSEAVDAIHAVLGELARPTAVQALAIPASLAMGGTTGKRALLVGAETGGGKTLAYLLPLIQRLKIAETEAQKSLPSVDDAIDAVVSSSSSSPSSSNTNTFVSASKLRRLRRPRAIVLVPSRDLVAQVTEVAKSLCAHHVRLTVLGIHARQAHPERLAAKLASTPIDVLITTPHELKKHLSQNTLALSKLAEVVIDESDTLFDESNSEDLYEIQNAIRTHMPVVAASAKNDVSIVDSVDVAASSEVATPDDHHQLQQLPLTTYISATFPVSMTSKIAAMHPEGYTQIATPRLHRPLPGLKQTFLSVSASGTKPTLLLDVLKRSAQSGEKRVIVFVNSRDTGTWVCDYLRGKKIVAEGSGAVFLANGQMEGKMREVILSLYKQVNSEQVLSRSDEALLEAAAVAGATSSIASTSGSGASEKLPWKDRITILVATDVASRGVDTTAADHVILYDFPRSSIEYLHRVGRTARNGGKGRATSLLTNRDRRVADEIEMAVKRGNSLC
ncbi:UNVERIFIED_CONTAM: hypothetical protein HDU68_005346 [Siphonaria sp. JEL0065]|nr:hypothetical protein HDU68_005346 [Siphonaria sp. JEL0065]